MRERMVKEYYAFAQIIFLLGVAANMENALTVKMGVIPAAGSFGDRRWSNE